MSETLHGLMARHAWTDETAHIEVAGVRAPFRVIHLSDVHVHCIDERDAGPLARFEDAHREYLDRDTYGPWRAHLEAAAQDTVGLLALTGDILHFPSHANVEAIRDSLREAGFPWLFTAGNHDWCFPYERESDAVRQAGRRRLAPLYDGDPCAQVRECGGIRFVAIDNSTYQVTPHQLDFFRAQLDAGGPVVLLIHVPLYGPALREASTRAFYPHSLLMGDPYWTARDRAEWGAPVADTAATRAFLDVARRAPNLVAVLAGHVHLPHAEPIGPSSVQYVCRPGYQESGGRSLWFVPAGAKSGV